MSINGMTNAAAARRIDIGIPNAVPKGLSGIAKAAATSPAAAPAAASGPVVPASGPAAGVTPVDTTLNVLFGYIPTEVVALYVAVVAAVSPFQEDPVPGRIVFACFVVATPIVVWLVYGAKVLAAGKPAPVGYEQWPVWEMTAALLAFVAWSFGLPGSPFQAFEGWYSPALAGVVVLVTSTVLGLLAPYFQRPIQGDASSDPAEPAAPA